MDTPISSLYHLFERYNITHLHSIPKPPKQFGLMRTSYKFKLTGKGSETRPQPVESSVVLRSQNNDYNRAIAASIIRGGEWALKNDSGGDPSGCARGDKCFCTHHLVIFISFIRERHIITCSSYNSCQFRALLCLRVQKLGDEHYS